MPRTEFTVTDRFGQRTLIIPENELAWSGDAAKIILDMEASSGTRLKNGENPARFIRLYNHFKKDRSDPNSGISFADYCLLRHKSWVDVVGKTIQERDPMLGESSPPPIANYWHSPDFASVRFSGKAYDFSQKQRKAIKLLWEAWEKNGGVGGGCLLEQAECEFNTRMSDLFKNNPAYGEMIIPPKGKSDIYKLAPKKS